MAIDALARRLERLLADGSIPSSQLSPRMRERLGPLYVAEALVDVKAGFGRRVELRKRDTLERFIAAEYPSGLDGTSERLPPRAEGVANYGDSKAGRKLVVRAVFMRGFGGALLRRGDEELPLTAMTAAYNLAGVYVDPERPWALRGRLALIENLELFMNVEAVLPDLDAALWTAGRIDQRVLEWIATMPEVTILHMGDYDPVGLDDYMRVRAALSPERVCMYVPEDLEARLVRYGNTKLLEKSATVLQRVRREGPPEVQEIMTIIDRHGKGLEHEGLLIFQE